MISLYKKQKQAITSFKQEFDEETLRRERQRSGVLAILFAAGFLLYGVVVRYLIPLEEVPGHQYASLQAALYMSAMMIYEFLGWLTIHRLVRRVSVLLVLFKFGNAALEISALTFTLYIISRDFDHPVLILLSPLTYLYFIFIVLSTLRLSVTVSLWTGALAALEFFALSYYLMESEPSQVAEFNFYLTRTFPYVMKAIVILLAGVGAAYVARQIRQSI